MMESMVIEDGKMQEDYASALSRYPRGERISISPKRLTRVRCRSPETI
jgi:hypothetical protein